MRNEDIVYPSYYTVIPSYIRYNKKLSYFEIILYSEIVALANKYGFTWASNNYFAKVFDTSNRTISRSINKMTDLQLIRVEIDKEGGNRRKIYINLFENNNILYEEEQQEVDHNTNEKSLSESNTPIDKNVHTPIDNSVDTPIDNSVHTPIDKNVYHNNTREFNTTRTNIKSINSSSSPSERSNIVSSNPPLNPFYKNKTKKYNKKPKYKKQTKTDVDVPWLDKYLEEMGIESREDVKIDWLQEYL